jgi:hypothetical protein
LRGNCSSMPKQKRQHKESLQQFAEVNFLTHGKDLCVRKTDKHGREIVDLDGLWLCRLSWGTSNLESLHQKLTKVFGHKRVGPQCSGNCHFCTGAIGRLQNEIGLSFLVSAIGTGLRPTPSMICMRRCLGCQSFHAGVNRGTLPPNHRCMESCPFTAKRT